MVQKLSFLIQNTNINEDLNGECLPNAKFKFGDENISWFANLFETEVERENQYAKRNSKSNSKK